MARSLRAVGPEDADKPKKKPQSHRDLLLAMKERISKAVFDPNTQPRDLASLTRRLQDIAKELELMDVRAKQEGVDLDGEADGDDEAWNEASI